MGWMETASLLGNLGEFVGSLAVVVTLIILVIQVRQSALAVEESNTLQRVATIDRHSDSIGQWRTQVASNPVVAEVWQKARMDSELDDIELLQLNFTFINFVNTQRANHTRARTVGETGLAKQAVLAVAAEVSISSTMQREWKMVAEWTRLASPDYVDEVTAALQEKLAGGYEPYTVGGLPNRQE
jgi:hypothetical protein